MADPAAERGIARTRRRFARRQWRRRWLAWRYLLVLALVIVLVGGGIWVVWFSSLLAVQQIDVSGADTVSSSDVRQLTGITTGTPLARVDLQRAETRVGSLAVVKSVDVTRQWPHTILVTIHERVPIAVVEIGGQLRGMDADGVVFRSYRKAPPGLPKIVTAIGTTADALQEAAKVVAALPQQISLLVDHVQVDSVDQISLILKDDRKVIWGSSSDSDTKAKVLQTLLGTPAKVYDVSVPSKPVTS